MTGRKVERSAKPDCEITPEMIAAGALALAEWNDDYESDEDAVVRIYLAMDQSRSLKPAKLSAKAEGCRSLSKRSSHGRTLRSL
jgi:hypothetical protein